MFLAYPETSPIFDTVIAYSTITVEPDKYLAAISVFAKSTLSYVSFVVPLTLCVVTLVIPLSSFKSNVSAKTKPISIPDTLPFAIVTTSVIAPFLVLPSCSSFVVMASELTFISTPSFLYAVTVYFTVSYSNITK